MIQFIRGILAETGEDGIVVDAGGVGYGIAVPTSLLAELPVPGEEVKIYTYLQVAEDSQKLYGFGSREDRSLFTLLLKVSGIGPKLAMSILSALDRESLEIAVLTGDVKTLCRAPGLGKKLAEKLILELKDKVDPQLPAAPSGTGKEAVPAVLPQEDAYTEAVAALTALGYSGQEALKAVRSVEGREDITVDEVLQEAFRKLAAF